MSSSNKLALPTKLKYGFADPHKLQDELFELCERHDALYMLDPDSIWKPVQQEKLNKLLASHAPLNSSQAALKLKQEASIANMRIEIDLIAQLKEQFCECADQIMFLSEGVVQDNQEEHDLMLANTVNEGRKLKEAIKQC